MQEVSDDSNVVMAPAPSCTPTSSWHINRRTQLYLMEKLSGHGIGNVWELMSYGRA